MKNVINTLFLTFALCIPHVGSAMTYDKVFATNCLTPKNSIELKSYNKHVLDHNFQPVQKQLKTATKLTFKEAITKKIDYLVFRPDVYLGYYYMGKNILGNIKQYSDTSLYFKEHRSEILAKSQIIKETAFPELWNMITELSTQVGVDSSKISMAFGGKSKTGSPAGTAEDVVFLYENFLKLPMDQQRAILAHELIHIKHQDARNNHIFKIISPALTTSVCLGSSLGITKLSQEAKKKLIAHGWNTSAKTIGYLQKATCGVLNSPLTHFTTSILLQLRHSRYLEKRADIESAKLCGTAAGLQASQQLNEIENQQALQKGLEDYPRLTNVVQKLYDSKQIEYISTHPLPQTRIKYLEPYVTQGK